MTLGADDGQSAGVAHIGGELDVGTSTGHVRGDGDGAEHAFFGALRAVGVGDGSHAHRALSSLSDDVGLTAVELSVEHAVRDLADAKHAAKQLGDLDRSRTHERGPPLVARADDLVDDGVVFLALRLVDPVVHVLTNDGLVGGDHDHVELVDVPKLASLGLGRTGHTGELVVHTEVVLECDRGEGLRGGFHLDAFLGFDGLMESVGIASALHDTTRLLVDDLHLPVDHDVLVVFLEEGVGLQQLVDSVHTLALNGVVREQRVLLRLTFSVAAG